MNKVNCMKNKNLVIYAEKKLVTVIRSMIKFQISIITEENLGTLPIIYVP